MEYIEGGTLRDLATNHKGPLPENVAKTLVYAVPVEVKYLHDNGTIRGDLEPDNCLLIETQLPYGPDKLSYLGLWNILESYAKFKSNGAEERVFLASAVESTTFIAPENVGHCR